MEYIVVAADYMVTFEETVNRLIGEGYFPLGGIQVVIDVHTDEDGFTSRNFMYHQAMTRTDEARRRYEISITPPSNGMTGG